MTPVLRTDVINQGQAPLARDATSSIGRRPSTAAATAAESAKIQQAAKDFETVFLRQMLSALEKTTKVGDQGPNLPGQQAYGSMIVEAVADAVAAAGGIGLGSVLASALIEKSANSTGDRSSSALPPQAVGDTHSGPSSRPVSTPASDSNFDRHLPQGLSSNAVPRTEIRTTTSQMMGQSADRRTR